MAGSVFHPISYQQIVSPSTATLLTPPAGATRALISCDNAVGVNIRWRDDGTAPTATVGIELLAGNDMFYAGDLTALQLIQVTTNATVNVSYYA